MKAYVENFRLLKLKYEIRPENYKDFYVVVWFAIPGFNHKGIAVKDWRTALKLANESNASECWFSYTDPSVFLSFETFFHWRKE